MTAGLAICDQRDDSLRQIQVDHRIDLASKIALQDHQDGFGKRAISLGVLIKLAPADVDVGASGRGIESNPKSLDRQNDEWTLATTDCRMVDPDRDAISRHVGASGVSLEARGGVEGVDGRFMRGRR
jgi:hypothetical protein